MPTSPRRHQTHGTARPVMTPELRDNANARGYTYRWQQFSAAYLMEHPLCSAPGCLNPATVVDHVIPHRGDDRLFWDYGNLASLCKLCHDRKTGRGQ